MTKFNFFLAAVFIGLCAYGRIRVTMDTLIPDDKFLFVRVGASLVLTTLGAIASYKLMKYLR